MLSLDPRIATMAASTSLDMNLRSGLGALADADMAAENAKLAALQIEQQLAIQALTIAIGQPQVLFNLLFSNPRPAAERRCGHAALPPAAPDEDSCGRAASMPRPQPARA